MRAEGRRDVNFGPEEGQAVRMPGQQLYTRRVGGGQTGGAFSLFEVEVEPGGGDGPHLQHREDECFYVLEGRFEFLVEDARVEAVPGDLVYASRGEMHSFENVGETVGRLLILHTPGGPHERFVSEVGGSVISNGSAPREQEAQEAARLLRSAEEYGIELMPPP